MDTLTLNINGEFIRVKKEHILDIQNGKALTLTKRWYDIICDQCEIDYESVEEAFYIVCNVCNKVTYIEDLK